MRRQSTCKCTMDGVRTIRRFCGSTDDQEEGRYSTSAWGRDRAGPKQFLENFHGILQTDAYQAYDKVGGRGMVHAGCWTHARRGFANVVKLNPGDPVATPIVAKINELFAVDAEAREQGLSVEARHRLRQQKAPERLE